MNSDIKLTIELVPSTCWYSNVRSSVSKQVWDTLRIKSYETAKNKCEICGSTGKKQGYSHDLECHEKWHYDDETKTQKLLSLISLCPRCHQCKHMGRTMAVGNQKTAFEHIEKVNNWNHKQVVDYIVEVFDVFKERSKYEWALDIQVLTETYGIPKELITEGRE